MAAERGRITPLAIATIFVVVLGSMQLGLAYSRGEVLQPEPLTDVESRLHADVWAAVNADRAERGLDPAQRGSSPRQAAQATARALVTMDYFEASTAVGVRTAGPPLPNRMALCEQVPAKLTVSHAGWNDGEDVSTEASRAVAAAVTRLLADEGGVLGRPNDHRHGLGVAVDGDVVYVVYRTCNLGY
jgi:hypothetical protein